jgi:hypothetical protein
MRYAACSGIELDGMKCNTNVGSMLGIISKLIEAKKNEIILSGG